MQADLRMPFSLMITIVALGCAGRVTTVQPSDSGTPSDTLTAKDAATADTYEGRMNPDAELPPCDDDGRCDLNAFCATDLGICCNGNGFDGGVCVCGEGLGCDALHLCCLGKFHMSEPPRCFLQAQCSGF